MNAQSLRAIIKSARDVMRKDDNLSTDVDRIPQFSWILFLKCFDDLEQKRESLDKNYSPIIPIGYRWKNWASEKDEKDNDQKVLTGNDLIKFVNDDLFPTLSKLIGGKGNEQQEVISSVFKELNNRFVSGYVLRKVVNKIDKIKFVSIDDIHTMALLYEHLLVEMRDAAGSNGEFYTPRPVIRFMVTQINPSLSKSEKILDPACGTGGFLVESQEFMRKQIGPKSDNNKLLRKTLYGIEKKPMPYLLGMMNLLLHGIDKPNIIRKNTLARPFREISENEQYEIIMTNPPFGGEEEKELKSNLPVGLQTSETASAFLLYIMYSLKKDGRCAIILPDGSPLSKGSTLGKIREKLLDEFNLHTIIRLPRSVFAPYTDYATNILFFDATEKTNDIWYYKMKVADRMRALSTAKSPKYNKTNPIEYEDFEEVSNWMQNKTENKNAWKVNIEELIDFNLDRQNPNDVDTLRILTPSELIKKIIKNQNDVIGIFNEIEKFMNDEISLIKTKKDILKEWDFIELGNENYFKQIIGGGTPSTENPDYFGGDIPWVRLKDMKSKYISKTIKNLTEDGLRVGSRKVPKNSVILSTRATIGKVGIAEVDLCTNQGFKCIICNTEKILPEFLYYYLLSVKPLLQNSGTTSNYTEINLAKLKKFSIPIPQNVTTQKNIIEKLNMILKYFESKEREILEIQGNNGNMMDDLDNLRSLILGIMFPKNIG